MKISGKKPPSGPLAGLGSIGETQRVDPIQALPVPVEPDGDQVVLSAAAREVQEALRHIRSVTDMRSEAVANLKEQIQRNVYPFDFRFIARKMMTEQLVKPAL